MEPPTQKPTDNPDIQYRLRTIKEKLLTGTETVLRLKGKIRMSILGPVHSAQTGEKSKPLDGMQIVFKDTAKV